jgi:hypothetical protein
MYKMYLEHVPNPDIGGYYQYPEDENQWVYGQSLMEMQNIFVDWIEKNGFGSGNIPCIYVIDRGRGHRIGKFSYNGRLWELGEGYNEILLKEAV